MGSNKSGKSENINSKTLSSITGAGKKTSGNTEAGSNETGSNEKDKQKISNAADVIPSTESAVEDTMSKAAYDPVEKKYFTRFLLLIGVSLLVFLFFFIVFFFLAVRGSEKTVVPSVTGKELSEALIELQERELYPRIQLKYTGNPEDKGQILTQRPEPGLYVKAGRRVVLTVSKGAIVDNVENYVGMNITDVRSRLAALFSTFKPLLIIKEPVPYVYNEAPPGTVIAQSPKPGTPLSGQQQLILIVSRGKLDKQITLQDYSGYSAENAMRSLAKQSIPFLFKEDSSAPKGNSPSVTSQQPPAGSKVGLDEKIILKYRKPASWPDNFRYGLFEYSLPEYPVPVLLEVLVRESGSDDRELFAMPHSGGEISFPYVLPVGSTIIVKVNGEEITHKDILSR